MTEENINRRDLTSFLGLAVGALAMTKCAPSQDEMVSSATAALKGTNPVWFDTIVGAISLRNTIGDSTKQVAIVSGYSAPGDGGGGVFWWDITGGADDAGTIIVPGASDAGTNGPCWRRTYSGALNVRWFGAKGDGATDDTAALMAAVAALKLASPLGNTAGVTLYVPKGVYLCSAQINLDTSVTADFPGVTIRGDGGGLSSPGSNRGASTIIYTGTGAGAFLSARSTPNVALHDLCLLYQSNSYTGTLLDFSESMANASTTYLILSKCSFGCDHNAYATATAMMLLSGVEACVIQSCRIAGATYGIRMATEGVQGTPVATTIEDCQFQQCTIAAITNPGFNTQIRGCVFEAVDRAVYCDYTAQGQPSMLGFVFNGNWCGDNSNNAVPWIDFGNGLVQGGSIFGNFFAIVPGNPTVSQKDSVRVGSCQGLVISGNSMGTIDFSLVTGGSYPNGVVIFGNQLDGGNTAGAPYWRNFNNNCTDCLMFGNNPTGLGAGAFDQLGLGGHIVTWPTLRKQPTIVGVTNVSATIEGTVFQGSNDICGRIVLTVTSSGVSSPGQVCQLTFANAFDTTNGYAPKVVVQAENAATATLIAKGVQFYVKAAGANFQLWCAGTGSPLIPAGNYQFSYIVMG